MNIQDIFKKQDTNIINRTPDVKQRVVPILESDLKKIASGPTLGEDIKKRDWLIDIYGKIVDEYEKILDVLRRRARANKSTILKLETLGPEVTQAAQKLFGENVKVITFDRYLDLLKLEKDLNAICAQETIDGGILDAEI